MTNNEILEKITDLVSEWQVSDGNSVLVIGLSDNQNYVTALNGDGHSTIAAISYAALKNPILSILLSKSLEFATVYRQQEGGLK